MFEYIALFFLYFGLVCASNSTNFELFSKNGNIVDSTGNRFRIKGISYYGMETPDYVMQGLDVQSYSYILDTLQSNSFNALRIPISVEIGYSITAMPKLNISYTLNPELKDKTSLEILDIIIDAAGSRGMLVMIDYHQVYNNYGTNGYFYEYSLTPDLVEIAMQNIAARYKNVWNVVAYDLKNEPWEMAWNNATNNATVDWRLGAETLGNVVLYQDPKALCFVEGVAGPNVNWGGNLSSAGNYPVILNVTDKVVYSPHAYGTSVSVLNWYYQTSFPENMPLYYGPAFGYLIGGNNSNAVVLGEWSVDDMTDNISTTWTTGFLNYLLAINLTDNFYWSVNPDVNVNATAPSGFFQRDWYTTNQDVLGILKRLNPNPTNVTVMNNGTSIKLHNTTFFVTNSVNTTIPTYFGNSTATDSAVVHHKTNLLPLYIVIGVIALAIVIVAAFMVLRRYRISQSQPIPA